MASLLTSLNGQYKSCGVGQPFSLQLQCNGPDCGAVLNFPGLQCQTVAGGQSCTNGVTCRQATNPQPSSSSGSGPPPPPVIGSGGGVTSSFTIQQDPQTGETVTNQNLDIQGQSITLNATSDGTATFQYGDITVSNNGTTSPSSPASTGKSSSSSKTYPLSNLFLIALVFFSMFVGQIHAQGVTWDTVLQGLPQENVQFIESLEPQLCASTIPVINAAVCGGRQSFLGVADIARICLQTVGEASQPADASGNTASQLVFSLANTIACDQIADAMLSDSQGLAGRELCNAYVPFSTCTTSVFTTEFTSSGMILVSTLSTLKQSSVTSEGSRTSAGLTSSGASPAVVSQSSGTVTSTTGSQESTSVSGSAQVVSSVVPVSTPTVVSSSSPLTSAAGNTTLAIKHRRFGGIPCDDERL